MQLSSKDNTILVLSDPHQDMVKVENILARENYDVAVCLGDWFDSFFYNTPGHITKTCQVLRAQMFNSAFVSCIGNHDIHYLYDNATTICSGYSRENDDTISAGLGSFLPAIRDRFKWYVWIDDWLCTHAGLNPRHLPPQAKLDKINLSAWLNTQIEQAEMHLCNGGRHWLYGCGAARGGRQNIGGLTWQDFDVEFESIEEVPQLLGHTHHPVCVPATNDGTLNRELAHDLCIDCNLSEYLLILNGKITIKRYIDLA